MSAPGPIGVVVLGGYGNFGRRIAAALADEPNAVVFIAGRRFAEAVALAAQLAGNTRALQLDHRSIDFAQRLRAINARILIHTAGPFQGQDYQVAGDCIAAGCHYIDLADAREYVVNIEQLAAAARAANVLVVAGASSLPALSSAVVDEIRSGFSRIDCIEHGITSGAKPPGIATMQGVLSYVGKAFARWERGRWRRVYGWQGLVPRRFPAKVGRRWLANCDVPDLELFPKRYAPVDSVVFRAGIGFASTTWTVWLLSWLVRVRWIDDLASFSRSLHRAASAIEPLGSKSSAMYVQLSGKDANGRSLQRTWTLIAGDNAGPSIPCFPAVSLARKMLRGEISRRGAIHCMGLLTAKEILDALPIESLHVELVEEREGENRPNSN